MTGKGFEPMSSHLGIPGAKYRLQLGLINGKWAYRLLKGNDVIDSYVYKDEDIHGGFPNLNLIVGWVIRTVANPNINPYLIMKTTQALVKQALRKYRLDSDDDEGDLPFPYILKPPTPPGDLSLAGEPQAKEHIIKQSLEYESFCKHCGAELPEGQAICHACGKKVI
ncbi:MAG: zinc ribbon domain-containing protein [Candidatus Thorarchaeota archaeon]